MKRKEEKKEGEKTEKKDTGKENKKEAVKTEKKSEPEKAKSTKAASEDWETHGGIPAIIINGYSQKPSTAWRKVFLYLSFRFLD